MNRKVTLFLMFGPFILFFVGLGVLVNDARHPSTLRDECVVTGTGAEAQPFKDKARFIYRQSENIKHDVSLRCQKLGPLMLNDIQLFITPIKIGQGAWVSLKQYHILPKRWMVSVYTGKEE
ncbi:hypothetical protein [Vampirovibrio chlorellavorus]|uniref:hypothetical protein n=1 Tax=Vampirovibrio chlorellavorus TaxID=758823 RepID=UPI0026ED83DB|nr:hypothetical protein [Vampirovibrio chlorellavorus]